MSQAADPTDADPPERSNGDLPDDAPDLDPPDEPLDQAPADGPPLPPPDEVLSAVADEARGLPFADLPALSAADDATVGRLIALWPQLTAQRRRDLLAAFQQHAEDDVTLDFDRIHLSALFDEDVATRILAIRGLWEHERHEYAELLSDLLRDDPASIVRAEAAAALGSSSSASSSACCLWSSPSASPKLARPHRGRHRGRRGARRGARSRRRLFRRVGGS